MVHQDQPSPAQICMHPGPEELCWDKLSEEVSVVAKNKEARGVACGLDVLLSLPNPNQFYICHKVEMYVTVRRFTYYVIGIINDFLSAQAGCPFSGASRNTKDERDDYVRDVLHTMVTRVRKIAKKTYGRSCT